MRRQWRWAILEHHNTTKPNILYIGSVYRKPGDEIDQLERLEDSLSHITIKQNKKKPDQHNYSRWRLQRRRHWLGHKQYQAQLKHNTYARETIINMITTWNNCRKNPQEKDIFWTYIVPSLTPQEKEISLTYIVQLYNKPHQINVPLTRKHRPWYYPSRQWR